MGALQDVRRQETQNRVAGAVDDDVALEHLRYRELGQVRRIKLGRQHQALAAHIDDGVMFRSQGAKLLLEVVADFRRVREQAFVFDGVDHGDGHGAGQRPAAECGSMHAGVNGACGFFGAENRTEGKAAGERLGQGGDVGLNAVVLIRAPLAGAAHAGLNLIDDEQSAGGTGQRAGLGKELLRQRTNAAFALDGLDEDGADFVGKLRAQIGDIVEAYKLDAGNHRTKRLAVLRLVRGRDRAEGAAVEALFQGQELRSDILAFAAQQARVGAGQLQCAFPRLSAGVGEEDAVQPGALGEAQRQLRLPLVKEEVGSVDQRAALVDDGAFDGGMTVAERVHADAAQQVEIVVAVFVDEMYALAANKQNRVAVVCGKEQPCLGGVDLFELCQFSLSWSACPADR